MAAKMTCPHCGAEMNFHAEKLVYSEAVSETIQNSALEEHAEEMHTCPRCGLTESRIEALGL
jgi:ribosomal protein S27AE